MRVAFTIAAMAVMIAAPAVLFAEGTGRKNPYSNLFTALLNGSSAPLRSTAQSPPQGPPFALPPQAVRMASIPAVVCGMTVMEGDSKIDPTMAHQPTDGSKAVITIVEPKICRR